MERSTYIPAERQKKMMEYIEANTSAQIHELAEKFHVSEATVRRDLDDLDHQGMLRRTHGGAMKVDKSASYESAYSERISLMMAEKHRIAERAARMVHAGDTVMISAGTTTYFIAQALSHLENLTLITNDLYIASQIVLPHTSTLVVTGGTRRPGQQGLIGAVAERMLWNTHVDIAFVGADGVDPIGAVTTVSFEEVSVKRLMLNAAARSVIVADHTKFGRVAMARTCEFNEVSLLLTDQGLNPELLEKFRRINAEVELA